MQKTHSSDTAIFGYKQVFSDRPASRSVKEIGCTSSTKNWAVIATMTFVLGVGAILYFSHTIAEEDKMLSSQTLSQQSDGRPGEQNEFDTALSALYKQPGNEALAMRVRERLLQLDQMALVSVVETGNDYTVVSVEDHQYKLPFAWKVQDL